VGRQALYRPLGSRRRRRLPRRVQRLARRGTRRTDRRTDHQRAHPRGNRRGPPETGAQRLPSRHRDRLRPRGRADRQGGVRAGARGERGRSHRPRPVLLDHRQRGKRGVREPRRARLRSGRRRGGPAGDRPDVGRGAHPLPLAVRPPARRGLHLRGPGAGTDAQADRRPRARDQSVRSRSVLGAVREPDQVRRRPLRGALLLPERRGQRGRARLERRRRGGPHGGVRRGRRGGRRRRAPADPHRRPADPVQHHGVHPRRRLARHSAQRAMSLAEDLYTAGYVTYPRTDNTVYPEDLDPAS